VAVTTVTGSDTLCFSGRGELTRDGQGTHLRYTTRGEDGATVTSSLHLGLGRAVADSGSYRLLLDPRRTTRAQIPTAGGALTIDVVTHALRAELSESRGTITLHYTLSSGGRQLETLLVTLELHPIRRENV
jgi:uncharacterized beta-barrel protein YwiB (DUF1934 family)